MKAKMENTNDEQLVGEDLETLMREIGDFCSVISQNREAQFPENLERYLTYVSNTGNILYPWSFVRPLFRYKLLDAIKQFEDDQCSNEEYVLERFDSFQSAPFTIQRFTELVTQPERHYRKKDKFLRGLEKTVAVVSTVEHNPLNLESESNNGVMEDDDMVPNYAEGDDFLNRTFEILNEQPSPTNHGAILCDENVSISVGCIENYPTNVENITNLELTGVIVDQAVDHEIVSPHVVEEVIATTQEEIVTEDMEDAEDIVEAEAVEVGVTNVSMELEDFPADVEPSGGDSFEDTIITTNASYEGPVNGQITVEIVKIHSEDEELTEVAETVEVVTEKSGSPGTSQVLTSSDPKPQTEDSDSATPNAPTEEPEKTESKEIVSEMNEETKEKISEPMESAETSEVPTGEENSNKGDEDKAPSELSESMKSDPPSINEENETQNTENQKL